MSASRRVVANRDNYEKVIDPTVGPRPCGADRGRAIDHAFTGQGSMQR